MGNDEENEEEFDFEEWAEKSLDESAIEGTITTGSSTDSSDAGKTPEEWREEFNKDIKRGKIFWNKVNEKTVAKYGTNEKAFAIPIKTLFEFLYEMGEYEPNDMEEFRELSDEQQQKKLKGALPRVVKVLIGKAGKWREPEISSYPVRVIKGMHGNSVSDDDYILVIRTELFTDAYGDTDYERCISATNRAYSNKLGVQDKARRWKKRCNFEDGEIREEFINNVERKICEHMGLDYKEVVEEAKGNT